MKPMSPNRIFRFGLAAAAALVVAAPASARVLPVDEADSGMAQYELGATATLVKQQTRTFAARTERQILAQYGWGAAATYAKLHA